MLPSPQDYSDWQSFASALISAIEQGDIEAGQVTSAVDPAFLPGPPSGFLPVFWNTSLSNLFLADGSFYVPPPVITPFQIDTQSLALASVELGQIADGAVSTNKLMDLAVVNAKIADATILSAKIGDAQIVEAKIGDLAVTTAKIGDLSVTTAKIGLAQITNALIGSAAIYTANIALAQITTALIGDAQITTAKIGAAQVLTANIGAAQITSALIASATILTANIAAAQITAALIDTAAIQTAHIGAAQIVTAHIGDAQIETAKIADLAVETLKIADQAVTIPVSAYTAGVSANPTHATWTTIQSVSITSSGAPIRVEGTCYAGPAEYTAVLGGWSEIRIVRGATVVVGPVRMAGNSPDGVSIAGTGPNQLVVVDQPGAGTYTYELQVYRNDAAGTTTPMSRSLFLLEVKK